MGGGCVHRGNALTCAHDGVPPAGSMKEQSSPGLARMELQLRDLAQLFNSMDPSPFFDKDLDADAEEFIVSWSQELPHGRELELVIHLATAPSKRGGADVENAVRHYFASRAEIKRREFR